MNLLGKDYTYLLKRYSKVVGDGKDLDTVIKSPDMGPADTPKCSQLLASLKDDLRCATTMGRTHTQKKIKKIKNNQIDKRITAEDETDDGDKSHTPPFIRSNSKSFPVRIRHGLKVKKFSTLWKIVNT
ncbi:hypothetical protein CEXT_520351 [Caerostris extrusa]|uniref:Uncharacterized protein n=1 Tax=Caerostris extrusa TaxID=172846 RepID=A0AAV4PIP4_CAEEX|nr:hypothetical protein CEXT_520351 [Caerostris extrusa]